MIIYIYIHLIFSFVRTPNICLFVPCIFLENRCHILIAHNLWVTKLPLPQRLQAIIMRLQNPQKMLLRMQNRQNYFRCYCAVAKQTSVLIGLPSRSPCKPLRTVLYLYCICIVFVLYLYCICIVLYCIVFVFVMLFRGRGRIYEI